MRVSRATAGYLLPLLILAGACKDQPVSRTDEGTLFLGSHESTDVVERVVSPGQRELVLEGYSGTIQIIATDTDVARLTITRRARGNSPAEAQSNLAGLNVEEEGDEIAFRYRFVADKPELSRYDISGEIPAASNLQLKWTSGSIKLDGLTGSVDVQTVNGDIGFVGTSRRVRLQSRNGDVSATIFSSTRGLTADTLAPIPAAPASYEFVTANGDVAASIPRSLKVRVDAMTSAGQIRAADMPFTDEKFGPVNAGARFTARLGTGSGQLKLSTQHGSILLIESPEMTTEMNLPPSDEPGAGGTDPGTPGVDPATPIETKPDTTSASKAVETAPASPVDTVRSSSK